MSKKLNNFIPRSTHYTVNKKGELVFISFCVDMLKKDACSILLEHPKRLMENKGVYKSLEHFKNNY